MARKRKRYTGEEKLAILRQHLLEGVAVSDICDEHDLQPTVFYRWQKQLFENGAAALERRQDPTLPFTRRIVKLEEKLSSKNEVIAELMEEQVKAKKELGDA